MEKQERRNTVQHLKKRMLALVLVTAMVLGLAPPLPSRPWLPQPAWLWRR